jgi:hypothetical protein
MTEANTGAWVRAGLWGLPVYGLLTFFTTLDPQPDPAEHYDEWARYVTTDTYVLSHVLGSALGLIFAVFGTVALGAHLARSRSGRLAMSSMVVTVLGMLLFLVGMGVSAFAAPMEGQAHLAGLALADLPDSFAGTVQSMVGLVTVVLLFVGNVLLGVAVWGSRLLPRWAGGLWILAAVLMYPFGLIVAAAVTGSTPPTVLVGSILVVVAGGWMALRAGRRSSRAPAGVQARPATP